MLEILISSTVLILALTALRFLLRGKINPRLQYALWLLAALRLLLPVSLVKSPVSVMNAVLEVPAAMQRLTAPENRRAPQTDNTQSPAQTASETETAPAKAQTQLTGSTILKLIWLTGAAAMALVVLAQNLRFLRRLRKIRQPFACMESPVSVWLASGLPSPCLVGLFRHEIYLTPEAAAEPDTRCFVLRHELAHFHAKDQLWSLLRLICQCLYWFDPFVWLAAALSRRDCELACDELRPRTAQPRRAEARKGPAAVLRNDDAAGEKEPQRAHHAYRKKAEYGSVDACVCAHSEPCPDGLHVYKCAGAAGTGACTGTRTDRTGAGTAGGTAG